MVLYNNKYHVISYTTKDGGTLKIDTYSNYTTLDTNLVTMIIGLGTKYFKIGETETDVYFCWSNDGITFLEVYRVAKASGYLGEDGYNTIVFGVDANNFEVAALLEKWEETILPIEEGT